MRSQQYWNIVDLNFKKIKLKYELNAPDFLGAKWKNEFSHKSFLASDNFCCLLMTIAKSLDLDQDQQNFGPDLDLNSLTSW